MKALALARAERGVQDVTLVYEDRSNPAVAIVEQQLAAAGIPFTRQSASLIEDLCCLAGARHLVVPHSTLAEAAALLSDHIETYVGFRSFESHAHIHTRPQALLLGVLRQKGVRAVLIDDAADDYIPARAWDASAAQIAMIGAYPMANLRVTEGDEADRLETRRDPGVLRGQLAESLDEAARIRHLLVASRARADALDARLAWSESETVRLVAELQGDAERYRLRAEAAEHLCSIMRRSKTWRVTAPLRWSSRLLRRLLGRSDPAPYAPAPRPRAARRPPDWQPQTWRVDGPS
jgi:hypothetical protein